MPMIDAGSLLETYIANGGKDLGEFLVGTQDRRFIEPPPDPSHLLEGGFRGMQHEAGLRNYAALCRELEMKGSSLKRMIGNNKIDSGDVVSRCEAKLGIEPGTRQDAMFWYLARGNKSLPSAEDIIADARKALAKNDANPQQIARSTALTLFDRSGYSHEKFGELSTREGMIKELNRNEGYSFSAERAELFARAILPGQPALADALSNVLLGLDRKKHIATLIAEMDDGDLTFPGLVEQVRKQRHQTQAEFAGSFTQFLKKEKCIEPPPAISQSMVEKWENNKVIPQGNAMGDALAKFLKLPPEHYDLVPREPDKGVPEEDRVKPEVWMERIRGGELTFADYIRTLVREGGHSFASFGKSIPHNEGRGISESFVSGWTKGKRANAEHAAALAARAGYSSEADLKDFTAFARTGRLRRSNPDEMLNSLLSGEIQLAEFVQQLRSEEGKSPEEMDRMLGLGKGTFRNMEKGRELRTRAAQNFADHMPYTGDRKEAFRQWLIRKGEEGPSSTGIDPDGYRRLLDASMEHACEQNLKTLRAATSGIRFNRRDPVVERWWRSMAAEHAAQDIEKTGHVSPAAVDGWNDLHDLLFSEVNEARRTSVTFKNHVEEIARFIRERNDEGTARRAMAATIIRAAEGKEMGQRDSLAHIAVLLNIDMLRHAMNRECKKLKPPPDSAQTWDKVYDSSHLIAIQNRISKFSTMDAYLKRSVHNNVIDMMRRQSRQKDKYPLDPELMEASTLLVTMPERSHLPKAVDILSMLAVAREQLSDRDREVLDILMKADPEQRGIQQQVAQELNIPEGTAGNRIYCLRASLAKFPDLMEALGDIFGSGYVEYLQKRRKRGGGHSRAGSDEEE